jgi:hypothetical protein
MSAPLATIVLVATTVYVSKEVQLAKSFEARASEWSDSNHWCMSHGCEFACFDASVADGEPSRMCVDQPDDDHCYRELFRAQVEAYDSNRLYDELVAVSPTGVAFVEPTRVR